jgi:hypothetical protein
VVAIQTKWVICQLNKHLPVLASEFMHCHCAVLSKLYKRIYLGRKSKDVGRSTQRHGRDYRPWKAPKAASGAVPWHSCAINIVGMAIQQAFAPTIDSSKSDPLSRPWNLFKGRRPCVHAAIVTALEFPLL